MFVLLATLPYIGAIAMYWLTTGDLFRDARGVVPSNWNWRLVAPVMIGGLTPLALAAKGGVDRADRGLLLTATGLAILFTLIGMGVLRDGKRFFGLQTSLTIGTRKLSRVPRWRVILIVGTILLCYGGTVNVIVASG
jgi:hypothetical protein